MQGKIMLVQYTQQGTRSNLPKGEKHILPSLEIIFQKF